MPYDGSCLRGTQGKLVRGNVIRMAVRDKSGRLPSSDVDGQIYRQKPEAVIVIKKTLSTHS